MVDKNEYKLKFEQMKTLTAEGDYEAAAELADTIQWRKVRNIKLLMKAGEIYSRQKRYDDAKTILQMAYERSPIGRMIIYRLAEIAVKMKSFEEAEAYYEEFVELAPHDNLKYVLRYKISKAKGTDIQTRIAILEELKEVEYTEEWAFELAYLYHKAGEYEKCIDACDELVLWFGEGIFVERALELKMLHQPLTETQEVKYRACKLRRDGVKEVYPQEGTIRIPEVQENVGKFDTTNLQEEIKRNMQQIAGQREPEPAKAQAVQEAGDIMDRLADVIPRMEAGSTTVKQMQEEDLLRKDRSSDKRGRIHMVDKNRRMQISRRQEDDKAEPDLLRRIKRAKPRAEEQPEAAVPNGNAGQEVPPEGYVGQEVSPGAAAPEGYVGQEIPPAAATPEGYVSQEVPPGAVAPENYESRENPLAYGVPEDHADREEPLSAAAPEGYESRENPLTYGVPEGQTGREAPLPAAAPEDYESRENPLAYGEPEGYAGQEAPPGAAVPEGYAGYESPPPDEDGRQETEDTMPEGSADGYGIPGEPDVCEIPPEYKMPGEYGFGSQTGGYMGYLKRREIVEPEAYEEYDAPVDLPVPRGYHASGGIPNAEASNGNGFEESIETEEMRMAEAEFYGIPVESLSGASADEPQPEDLMSGLSGRQDTKEIKARQIAEALDRHAEEITAGEETEEAAKEESPTITELNEEQKALFSYFVPVAGMEGQICQALSHALAKFTGRGTSAAGNILIQGGRGCGKTILATRLVKALKNEAQRKDITLGKIDGDKLNQKDLAKLLDKVQGGCLIIERAGEISRETAIKLSLLLENDSSGLLVILEDTRLGLEEALGKDEGLARKFTERIKIPVFTSDELVEFGKAYAHECQYEIDNMGVLALYNRISNIQRLDQPTTLTEVKDIIDDAIRRAEKKSLKKAFSILTSRRYTEDDYIILREKDFEE